MGRQLKSNILLTFVFVLFAVSGITQTQPITEEAWKEATENIDYTEAEKETKDLPSTPNFDWNINTTFIKYAFFFIVLGVLIYFLVRYLLTLQSNALATSDTKIEVNSLEEAEENPMLADLEKLIKSLLAEQKFREATRAYFLLILQKLYAQKLIQFKKQKTNFDYVSEVYSKDLKEEFSSLTTYFERIWYGEMNIEKPDFASIEPQFLSLLSKIENEKK